MAEKDLQQQVEEPRFLSYLLNQEQKHDCYFVVGDQQLVQPERIGVVKKMLLAHSVVLRTELEESMLAEKDDVPVKDLYPDTFMNLLKYVYGHDTTASLGFDAADNLLYAAEKYMMEPLKARLSARLMLLLSPDNICCLLNNPACYSLLELKSTITEILQYETDRVLESSAFLGLCPDGFVKILEQNTLNVEEVQVWRAAVKWAKHRGETEDSKVVRKQLCEPLKHIRVCTLGHEEFFQEVVTTDILEDVEVKLVNVYYGTKEKQTDLVHISNEIQQRAKKSRVVEMDFNLSYVTTSSQESLTILTKKSAIELLPLEFTGNSQTLQMVPEGLTYQCDCTIVITEITNYTNNTSTTTPVTVSFSQQLQYGAKFEVPVTSNGQNVRLLPNKKYSLSVSFTQPHTMYFNNSSSSCTHENICIAFTYKSNYNRYSSPVKKLSFRPIRHV
uniref:BTB domain-containing protein n=2 Tax=Graphocephala atropunctata TaxID=36148 RepID=A0A1B6LDP1_9HEMI